MFPPWNSSALSPQALLPHALASPSYTAVAAGTHQLHLPPPLQPLTSAPAPNIRILSFPTVSQLFSNSSISRKKSPVLRIQLQFSKHRAVKKIWYNQGSIKVSSLCATRENPIGGKGLLEACLIPPIFRNSLLASWT